MLEFLKIKSGQFSVILLMIVISLTFSTPGVHGLDCYVCKTSQPAYDGPVNCPNINNPGTTVKQDCLSGVCLTFRGSQQRNTYMIEDGVVRLCASQGNINTIFGTTTISLNSGENCRKVAYSSSNNIHDNTAINGEVCTCTSNLCNTKFQSNAATQPSIGMASLSLSLLTIVFALLALW